MAKSGNDLSSTVFVRSVPLDVTQPGLHAALAAFGPVKSCRSADHIDTVSMLFASLTCKLASVSLLIEQSWDGKGWLPAPSHLCIEQRLPFFSTVHGVQLQMPSAPPYLACGCAPLRQCSIMNMLHLIRCRPQADVQHQLVQDCSWSPCRLQACAQQSHWQAEGHGLCGVQAGLFCKRCCCCMCCCKVCVCCCIGVTKGC